MHGGKIHADGSTDEIPANAEVTANQHGTQEPGCATSSRA